MGVGEIWRGARLLVVSWGGENLSVGDGRFAFWKPQRHRGTEVLSDA